MPLRPLWTDSCVLCVLKVWPSQVLSEGKDVLIKTAWIPVYVCLSVYVCVYGYTCSIPSEVPCFLQHNGWLMCPAQTARGVCHRKPGHTPTHAACLPGSTLVF